AHALDDSSINALGWTQHRIPFKKGREKNKRLMTTSNAPTYYREGMYNSRTWRRNRDNGNRDNGKIEDDVLTSFLLRDMYKKILHDYLMGPPKVSRRYTVTLDALESHRSLFKFRLIELD
ncbi:hypothetical protein ACJX0J_030786, partial [Zea mays]